MSGDTDNMYELSSKLSIDWSKSGLLSLLWSDVRSVAVST